MKVFSLKVSEDSATYRFLSEQKNVNSTLQYIIETYLSEHGNNPPPPPAPVNPSPTSGLTAQDMEDALYNALVRAKNNHGIQVTFSGGQEKAPLNQEPAKNGKLPPPPGKSVDKGVTGRFVDDDGGAEPLAYATESPDEILSSMGMA